MNKKTARAALLALAVPAVAGLLSACSGGSTPAPVPSHVHSGRPVVTSPVSTPLTRASSSVPARTAHRTALATPAEVTLAYAAASLGNNSLWSHGTPTESRVLDNLSPYFTGRAIHDLRNGPANDVWHTLAFSIPSLGHASGIGPVTVTTGGCTLAGVSARCTAVASAVVTRANTADLHITRSITVRLVPAPVRGGAAWLIAAVHNVDRVS